MRIRSVGVFPVVMRKTDPTWRFALGASPQSDGFLIRLVTDGQHEGIGYTTAVPHLDAPASRVLEDLRCLSRALAGASVPDVAELDLLPGCHQAKAGIDIALHDLAARERGVPLHRVLGAKVRDEVPLLRILALKAPEQVARIAAGLVAEGYRYLKIKLDGDLETDVARVRAVREAVGPSVHLTVDANQSYAAEGAIRAGERMQKDGIELFEQPVRIDDVDGLAAVSRALEVPVEADESAQSPDDIRRLIDRGAVDSVSLKLPKLGGLAKAKAAAEQCAAAGVRCRVGATVGSRLVAAAGLHFAAVTPNISYACELAEFARLQDDPAEGLEPERGILRVPEGVGLGVRLRETQAVAT
ncbi:MAG: dipeptide epimerase [Chloroflexota bacterium]|nr:dipeptide epimerase [Chloroflexota bacterium]